MIRPLLLLSAALLLSPASQAQQMKRQLGDFDFTLGTTPSRSMAQGLISPSAVGAFHGGLDLSHPNGWYLGQYAPSMGVTPTRPCAWTATWVTSTISTAAWATR